MFCGEMLLTTFILHLMTVLAVSATTRHGTNQVRTNNNTEPQIQEGTLIPEQGLTSNIFRVRKKRFCCPTLPPPCCCYTVPKDLFLLTRQPLDAEEEEEEEDGAVAAPGGAAGQGGGPGPGIPPAQFPPDDNPPVKLAVTPPSGYPKHHALWQKRGERRLKLLRKIDGLMGANPVPQMAPPTLHHYPQPPYPVVHQAHHPQPQQPMMILIPYINPQQQPAVQDGLEKLGLKKAELAATPGLAHSQQPVVFWRPPPPGAQIVVMQPQPVMIVPQTV